MMVRPVEHLPDVSRRVALAVGGGGCISIAELALGMSACSDAKTAGKRVELASSVAAQALAFTNAYGFELELSSALLSIGPLRYLQGAPVALFRSFRWIRSAHAHPGHYVDGDTVGEMLAPVTVELAQGVTALGTGAGVAGIARSARFLFQFPAEGELAERLGESVVLVEGTASAGQERRAFRARAGLEDVLDADGHPSVAGCAFENGDIRDDGVVRLTVRPSVWLDQVDFSELPAGAAGPSELEPESTPHKAFARGLRKAAAFVFAYEPGTRAR
jgi:hypothetical protein